MSWSSPPHPACIVFVTIQPCPHPSKRGGAFIVFVAIPTSLKEGEGQRRRRRRGHILHALSSSPSSRFIVFIAVPTSLKEGEGPASSSSRPHLACIVLGAVCPYPCIVDFAADVADPDSTILLQHPTCLA